MVHDSMLLYIYIYIYIYMYIYVSVCNTEENLIDSLERSCIYDLVFVLKA